MNKNIKQLFLIIRDFSHVCLKKIGGADAQGNTAHPIWVAATIFGYYFVIFIIIGGLQNRFKIRLPDMLRYNILVQLIFGMAVFMLPIIYITKKILDDLKPIPLPESMPKEQFRKYGLITLFVCLLGYALVPGLMLLIDHLWPPNDLK